MGQSNDSEDVPKKSNPDKLVFNQIDKLIFGLIKLVFWIAIAGFASFKAVVYIGENEPQWLLSNRSERIIIDAARDFCDCKNILDLSVISKKIQEQRVTSCYMKKKSVQTYMKHDEFLEKEIKRLESKGENIMPALIQSKRYRLYRYFIIKSEEHCPLFSSEYSMFT